MNCPFTVLLGVKGNKCKPMTPQNDVTQTLDRKQISSLQTTSGYSSICNVARFLEHEEKWISDSIHHTWQFCEMVVQRGKWIRFAMWPDVVKWAAGPQSCISCQYSWSLHCELLAGEMRAEMIVCMPVNNASMMQGGTNGRLVVMAWPYKFK